MTSFFNFNFSNGYRRVGQVEGHSGGVNAVAVSQLARFLASAGGDGIRVWDLRTYEEVKAPQQPLHERGQASCVVWTTQRNERYETLCYGNALGWLVFLRSCPTEGRFERILSKRGANGSEITCLAVDASGAGRTTRIASGTRDQCVLVWSFNSSKGELEALHSVQFGDNIVPKGLAFSDAGSSDVYIFSLWDGGLHTYNGDRNRIVATRGLGSRIGHAAVDPQRRLCVVDNVGTGFDMYDLDGGQMIRHFPTGVPTKTYPKGVAFGEDSRVLVGGSDHGCVYVFNRRTGAQLEVLRHAREGGVQTITTHEAKGKSLIVSASATGCGKRSTIVVWERSQRKVNTPRQWHVQYFVDLVIQLLMLVATIAFVYQNWTNSGSPWNFPWTQRLERQLAIPAHYNWGMKDLFQAIPTKLWGVPKTQDRRTEVPKGLKEETLQAVLEEIMDRMADKGKREDNGEVKRKRGKQAHRDKVIRL